MYTLQSLLQRLSVYDPSGEIAVACATQSAGGRGLLAHPPCRSFPQQGADNQYLLILSQSMHQVHRNLVLSMGKGVLERSLQSYATKQGGNVSSACVTRRSV